VDATVSAPPTLKVAVPAEPIVPLSEPDEALFVRVTLRVSDPPERVMVTDAGTVIEKVWPPSPPTVKAAREVVEVASAASPPPDRAGVSLALEMVTVLEPVVGRTTVPNARSESLVSVIGWTIFTEAVVDWVAELWARAGAARAETARTARAVLKGEGINDPFAVATEPGRGAGEEISFAEQTLKQTARPTNAVRRHTNVDLSVNLS
jgi:hypothetical protein